MSEGVEPLDLTSLRRVLKKKEDRIAAWLKRKLLALLRGVLPTVRLPRPRRPDEIQYTLYVYGVRVDAGELAFTAANGPIYADGSVLRVGTPAAVVGVGVAHKSAARWRSAKILLPWHVPATAVYAEHLGLFSPPR